MATVKAWKATSLTSNSEIPDPIAGFKTFQSQVAGHLELKNKPCFLEDRDGHVLKMVDFTRTTGIVETAFFERIFNAEDDEQELIELQKFLPSYHGLQQIDVDGSKLCYLKLENLVAGFARPSVMDIKVGRITSDPYADDAKVQREALKYKFQKEMGFRVLGSKSYKARSGRAEFVDKTACKKLTPGEIPDHISNFLDLKNFPARHYLVKRIVEKLKRLQLWFSHQNRVKFFSSSILIAFDGEKVQYKTRPRPECKDTPSDDVVVKMIDFPHTYIDLNGSKTLDSNYIYGLKNLTAIFENLESNKLC